MTTNEIIKSAGLKVKRIESSIFKGAFGGSCNHVIALVNINNEVLHLDGKPYFPAGRNKTFASLISSKSLNSNAFSFKSLN